MKLEPWIAQQPDIRVDWGGDPVLARCALAPKAPEIAEVL
jgi:hypothetical protein